MLGKLIKHEYKATARTMLPVLALFMLLSVAMRFITDYATNLDLGVIGTAIEVVVVIAYVIIFAAVCFLGYFSSVLRFSKNIFSDEGYLMNTIPVKPWMHIVSKLLTAFTWLVACILACVFSVSIASDGLTGVKNVFEALGEICKVFFDALSEQPFYVFQVVVACILGIVLSYLTFYCSLAIGNSFAKNKKVMSVLSFVALFTIGSIIMVVVSDILLNAYSDSLVVSTQTVYDAESAGATVTVSNPVNFKEANIIALVENITTFVFCVVTFIGANYFMKNKLNLE